MRLDPAERREHEGRQPCDRARQTALRLEVGNRPPVASVGRIPRLRDDLPAIRGVGGERLGTLARPSSGRSRCRRDAVRSAPAWSARSRSGARRRRARDATTSAARPTTRRQRRERPGRQRRSAAAPATAAARSCHGTSCQTTPSSASDRDGQQQRADRERGERPGATPPRDRPPHRRRERDDDHDPIDGAHERPPEESGRSASQTRASSEERKGGCHAPWVVLATRSPPVGWLRAAAAAPRRRAPGRRLRRRARRPAIHPGSSLSKQAHVRAGRGTVGPAACPPTAFASGDMPECEMPKVRCRAVR